MRTISPGWLALVAAVAVVVLSSIIWSGLSARAESRAWVQQCTADGGRVLRDLPSTENPMLADGENLVDVCLAPDGRELMHPPFR